MTDAPKTADALRDAAENVLIAWGMGWDMEGVLQALQDALPADSLCKTPRILPAPDCENGEWDHEPSVEVDLTTDRSKTAANRTGHDINCAWQLDQYAEECTCGTARPRAPGFVPFEQNGHSCTADDEGFCA